VSFYVFDEDDDPRLPTLMIGTNTDAQVERMTPEASDADEARWNFAFWTQNALRIVGGSMDPRGQEIVDEAFEVCGLSFADEDLGLEENSVESEMTKLFVDTCVTVAQQLHRDGVLVATFGRAIPIVVHELEYYDEIVEQTREANPVGLVDDFARWVDSF